MQPGLHGTLGDIQGLCDLIQRHPVHETQRECLALAGRQAGENPSEVSAVPVRRGGHVLGGDVIGNREPARLARSRDRGVFRNGVEQSRQPGAQRYPLAGGREPAQQLYEGVLEHVQRGIDIGRKAQRDPQYEVLMTQVQGLERGPGCASIPVVADVHQRLVAARVSLTVPGHDMDSLKSRRALRALEPVPAMLLFV